MPIHTTAYAFRHSTLALLACLFSLAIFTAPLSADTVHERHYVDRLFGYGATTGNPADIDGDGDLDFIAAHTLDDEVYWYENLNGDAQSWQQHMISTNVGSTTALRAVDLDGDHDLDLIASSFDSKELLVFHNLDGLGTSWGSAVIASDTGYTYYIEVADIDLDGDMDLAISDSGTTYDFLWLENADGLGSTWTEHTVWNGYSQPWGVAVADMDSDGDTDIVTAVPGIDDLVWYENSGLGSTWTARVVDGNFDKAIAIDVGDLDGDGDLDILGVTANGVDGIAWYENTNGDALSWTSHTIDSSFYGQHPVAQDMDGDGDLDLVIGEILDDDIWWYENTAGDASTFSAHLVESNANHQGAYVADIDSDGDPDIIATDVVDGEYSWWKGQKVIGEVGQVQITHAITTVSLNRSYVDPVVFAQPPSHNGGGSSVVRITDVQSDSFSLHIDEAPNLNGNHPSETVSYLVLEAGHWQLEDGIELEVGKVDTAATVGRNLSDTWETVTFEVPFDAPPVVISQVQSLNDTHWVKTRQELSTTTSVDIALEEDEAQTTAHGSETIGWLAIDAIEGYWNGRRFEAAESADNVTDAWTLIDFGQSFTAPPRFIGALASHDGADNSALRYDAATLSASGVEVHVEEDQTSNTETGHTTERVSFLAIQGDGDLTALRKVDYDADSDGDSLPDGWEIYGYDADGDGIIDVDLPALGANYHHKDIFVEMDYMVRTSASNGLGPNQNVLDAIERTFANAPIENLDGRSGIRIHLELDDEVPYDADLSPKETEFDALMDTYFDSERAAIYFYMIWGNGHSGTSSSGTAFNIPSPKFLVSLGLWEGGDGGTEEQKIGTFVHELGHCLGLGHGGVDANGDADGDNRKPNYLSVMSYSFQTRGVWRHGSWGHFDFQRFDMPDLDEDDLDETVGLAAGIPITGYGTRSHCDNFATNDTLPANGAIDWDCDGSATSTSVKVNIDRSGPDYDDDGLPDWPTYSVLKSRADWPNLVFDGNGVIGSGEDFEMLLQKSRSIEESPIEELSWEEHLRMEKQRRRGQTEK